MASLPLESTNGIVDVVIIELSIKKQKKLNLMEHIHRCIDTQKAWEFFKDGSLY
jgi:hypothetical protein